ncbi:MAG: hypothetical protein MUE40_01540 [Anaerolineae bacterium]|jgi:hypothetical protein|nr:hypothetical protein [Anaerolineae bacterium]
MTERSIFFEEWRRCLCEHYRHVIRTGDDVTRRSLVKVLERVGFTDDELRQLYLEATLRAEDMPADFVPDAAQLPFQVHPAECTCAACMDEVLEAGHDVAGQPLPPPEPLPSPEPAATGLLFSGVDLDRPASPPAADSADSQKKKSTEKPRQMSMF